MSTLDQPTDQPTNEVSGLTLQVHDSAITLCCSDHGVVETFGHNPTPDDVSLAVFDHGQEHVAERRTFNPHRCRTIDGVLITEGLRVIDYNMDLGTVVGKAHGGDHGQETDWWWTIRLDGGGVSQMNGSRMWARPPGFDPLER